MYCCPIYIQTLLIGKNILVFWCPCSDCSPMMDKNIVASEVVLCVSMHISQQSVCENFLNLYLMYILYDIHV